LLIMTQQHTPQLLQNPRYSVIHPNRHSKKHNSLSFENWNISCSPDTLQRKAVSRESSVILVNRLRELYDRSLILGRGRDFSFRHCFRARYGAQPVTYSIDTWVNRPDRTANTHLNLVTSLWIRTVTSLLPAVSSWLSAWLNMVTSATLKSSV
jgi:hypothetical protein